jgi:uncharacterized protein
VIVAAQSLPWPEFHISSRKATILSRGHSIKSGRRKKVKFATTIQYGNPDRIAEVRPVHREYLSGLREQGKLFASGPFEDDSGALIIYEADSVEEAQALLEADPFREAGVFETWEMKPWRQVF